MISKLIEFKASMAAIIVSLVLSINTSVVDSIIQLSWHVFMSLVGGIVTWIIVRRLNKRFK